MPAAKRQTAIAQPFVLQPSASGYGIDGSWSPFQIRVGTPPQYFNVLVSLGNSEVWLPNRQGCESVYTSISNCGNSRGANNFNNRASPGFQSNLSSTWSNNIGDFGLPVPWNNDDPQWPAYTALGALYGNDTFGLEDNNGPSGPDFENQLIASIVTTPFWLGMLGLGIRATSDFPNNPPAPSFLTRMRDEGRIPSLSYGFAAGALYKDPVAPANLVLGGYDRARVTGPSISVPIRNATSPFVVGLQSIQAENSLQGTTTLSSNSAVDVIIESVLTELWLPRNMCDQFQTAFGLNYDDSSNRYFINDTSRETLLNNGANITFRIGESSTSGNAVEIEMPYQAFDQRLSPPDNETETTYFPLRRANETQYALGRVFLQNAYLVVDYDRGRFNLSAAMFSDPMPAADVVPITASDRNGGNPADGSGGNEGSGGGGGGLSGGAIGGIVVGVVGGLALIAFLVWFFVIRKRKTNKENAAELAGDQPQPYQPPMKRAEAVGSPVPPQSPPPEFDAVAGGPSSPGFYAPQKASELPTPDNIHELQGSSSHPDPLDKAGRSLNATL